MKKHILLLLLVCSQMVFGSNQVNYTADNSSIFPNPERGFITELSEKVSASTPNVVKGNENFLKELKSDDNISMVLVLYNLENFRTTSTIPSAVLEGFDEDMQVLRDLGMKCILRFAYTEETYKNKGVESGKDATLEIVQSHISQFASHWQSNADVIYVFEAGFVGAWGEWYYSDNFGNKVSTMNESRRAVVDALLAAVPTDRYVQLRTPLFKTGYVGDTEPLTAEEAYTDIPKARLGHHNDAFLYNYDNMGTYSDTATQKPYVAKETFYVPMGGETDIEDEELAAEWATYDKTTAEMSRMHWSFINGYYSPEVTSMWRGNGTFDELNRKMGYRYQLVNGMFDEEAAQGGKLSVQLNIRNAGYAPLYNERPAYIVLKAGSAEYSIRMESDPRSWLPNGEITAVNEQLTVPTDVPEGTYDLYLYLPDAYETIAGDARFAVRFANENVWDAGTGMNALNASVTITGKQLPPPPEGVVLLPGTLNKANVDAYSDDMTWYNTDYFDFGPDDAPNTERWAEWQVELRFPGNYIVSAKGSYPNGHQWQLQLTENEETYALPASWEEGEVTETGETKWNLTDVTAGIYTLRAQNIMEWGQPKLLSLTLQYDGELPVGPTYLLDGVTNEPADQQAFDLLGRPVDDSYRGIVVERGKKVLKIR